MKETPNDTPLNDNMNTEFNCVNKYTPFKFNLNRGIREKSKDIKKYYGFIYYENSNKNKSNNKNEKSDSKEIEENITEDKKKENNDNENNIKINNINKNENKYETNVNNSVSSNNKNIPIPNNLDKLIDIVKEDDENEYSESEGNRDFDYHSYSDDDFGFGPNFTARQDSCLKILVINIVETYNTLNSNYKYQMIKEEEGKVVLTEPSEGVNNNGKDNKYDDLIVYKEDELKNKKKNTSYIIKSLLGTGVSGQAFKAFCPNDNNYYALKIFKKYENLSKNCIFETKIMEYLNKNDVNDQYHIIRLYDYFSFNNHFCIVIELLHKTLYQLLEMNNLEGISLNSIRYILRQILKSVEFMHNLKIVHTDLKPENILLSINKGTNNLNGNSNLNLSNLNNQKSILNQINNNTSGINTNNMSNLSLINQRVNIKIADFGNSCFLKNLDSKIYLQSLYYRAPEAILHLRDKNEKIDIWSIGCILGELYLGNPIMPGNSSYDQLYKINILIGEIPQYMIEQSNKRDVYFTKDNLTYNYRIKSPNEYYKENPDVPKSEYEIPKNMKNIDDLINVKRDIIKSKNSLHKSMHNSSLSLNSSNTKEDLVAFIHLMKGMLQIDPKKRWNCKQCLKHPFLTKEKLDKFISFELNEINQFMSNSFSNNSYNFQNNNCHSVRINNNSFNKFQGNINKNNTFYGGKVNNNKNNYSFGNFNNNNFNYMPYIFKQNSNINNNIYTNNNLNNNFQQGNTNINNKKMNSSFSYNNNYMNMMYNNNPFQFNFVPNRMYPQNFFPYPNNAYMPYNNPNMMYKNVPYFQNNNYLNIKLNNTYMGTHTEKLNTSYNSNMSKHSKKKNSHFKKNNPKEFLFNKENILGNLEDNKQEEKPKDKINNQPPNEENIISKESLNNENKKNNLNKFDNNAQTNPENDSFETKK